MRRMMIGNSSNVFKKDGEGVVVNVDTVTNDVENQAVVPVIDKKEVVQASNIQVLGQMPDTIDNVPIMDTHTNVNDANPVDGVAFVNESDLSAFPHSSTNGIHPVSSTADATATTNTGNRRRSLNAGRRLSLTLSTIFGKPVINSHDDDSKENEVPIESYEYERMSVRPNLPQAMSKSQQLHIQSQRTMMIQSSFRNSSAKAVDGISEDNDKNDAMSHFGIGIDVSDSVDGDNQSESGANDSKSDQLGRLSAHARQPQYNHRNTFFLRRRFSKSKDRKGRASLDVGRREDKVLFQLKIIFVFLLIIAAAVAGVVVFQFLKKSEQKEFGNNFDYLSKEIKDKIQYNVQSKLEAINTLAYTIQSFAINTNQTWPYVTVPYFEEHVAGMKTLTDAYAVQLFPIVHNSTERKLWEAYSVKHNDWINTSYLTQQIIYGRSNRRPVLDSTQNITTWFDALWGPQYRLSPTSFVNLNRTVLKVNPNFEIGNGMSDQIMSTRNEEDPLDASPHIDLNPNGPYFPQWQAAPMSWYYQTTINSNYGSFDDFLKCTNITMTYKAACLGDAWRDDNAPGYITTMMYPIFDTFRTHLNTNTNTGTSSGDYLLPPSAGYLDEDMMTSTGDNSVTNATESRSNATVVAVIGVDIFWESYLNDVLPNTAKSIYVVVSSTCNQTFTFRINGTEATTLVDANENHGDFHETRYDGQNRSIRFGQNVYKDTIRSNLTDYSTSSYLGQELYDGFCQYDFHIYPSRELEEFYLTSKPITSTVVVVLIFVFTIMVFIGYDYMVERRQRLVMRTAVLSDTIVSSLFPSNVKQRLYNEADERDKLENKQLTNSMHNGAKKLGLEKGTTATNRDDTIGNAKSSTLNDTTRLRKKSVEAGNTAGVTTTASLKGGDGDIFADHTDPTMTSTSAFESILFQKDDNNSSILNFDDIDEDDDVTEFLMTMKTSKKGTMNTASTETSTTKSQPGHDEEEEEEPRHRQSFVSAASGNSSNASGLGLNFPSSPRIGPKRLATDGTSTNKKNNLSNLFTGNRAGGFSSSLLSPASLASAGVTRVVGHNAAGIPISNQDTIAAGPKIGGRAMIAEEYPHTTVLFADLVGFTKWCSERKPNEVFFLLETIYGKFDSIAARRHVFKIETIGDCYVAATGLPEPQPDHAIIMSRFANDIVKALQSELKNTIGPALGSTSLDLALRVGLNSGSVIAGVLRGDKARFQLFGDTMNTAARMESNSQRNRIHVSRSTADLLHAGGKAYWVTPREDLIEAKGKGKMQTYWVKVGGSGASSKVRTSSAERRRILERRNAISAQHAPSKYDDSILVPIDQISTKVNRPSSVPCTAPSDDDNGVVWHTTGEELAQTVTDIKYEHGTTSIVSAGCNVNHLDQPIEAVDEKERSETVGITEMTTVSTTRAKKTHSADVNVKSNHSDWQSNHTSYSDYTFDSLDQCIGMALGDVAKDEDKLSEGKIDI